jgi:putative tryptophan/tyrosine transport system substrate-binding protein
VRRRAFIALIAAAATSIVHPRAPCAQQDELIRRVGILFPAGEAPGLLELKAALAPLGYVEGRNILYDVRAAGREPERLPQLARELLAGKPNVIVSATTPAARALSDTTREIPIVLALIGDPIALGLTENLARPTRNVTGFTTGNETVAGKRLEILHEMVPMARKIALLWVRGNAQHRLVVERTREAALALNIEILSLPVTTEEDISPAITKAEVERAAALVVAADPMIVRNRRTIIDDSLLRNLPTIHSYSVEVQDGALMSYGGEVGEDYGRAATYVDRILKGAKIVDLPFQEPIQIELVINLGTARSLGISVPPSLLNRADRLIE